MALSQPDTLQGTRVKIMQTIARSHGYTYSLLGIGLVVRIECCKARKSFLAKHIYCETSRQLKIAIGY